MKKNNYSTENNLESNPQQLSAEEEDILEKNIVWVIGSSRSGTTWLATQLLSYDTHVINETRISRHLGRLFGNPEHLESEIESEQHRKDYFFSLELKKNWMFHLRKFILNRIYAQFNNINKKIIIKEPSADDIGFTIISECLSNSKIIFVKRDGRDVLDSQIDANIHGFSKGGRFESKVHRKPLSPENRLNFIKNRAYFWVKVMENLIMAYENHPDELKISVSYENLRKNTFQEILRIYQFLQIKIESSKLEEIINKSSFENVPSENKGKGKFIRSASPGKWKDNFSQEEQKIMNDVMEETLNKVGY